MTKEERKQAKESERKITAALYNPFKAIHLTAKEWERYKAIKEAWQSIEELG